ncbi:MAG: TrmH family RNA methyltransferase [Dehalococcoidales bacterium]|nr:MAG: TrmH family RNA methyltransferase [Dehalococcoidales bacterium]
MTNKIKAYKKNYNYSYSSGACATIELIKARPEIVDAVHFHSSYRENDELKFLCESNSIRCIYSDRAFNSINRKENSYVFGIFHKYASTLDPDQPHIVVVNPSDMGNLGTIIRTIAGLGIKNLAVIEPAADIWNPKTIRASMGALFHIQHECFPSFDDYTTRHPDHRLFMFVLDGTLTLDNCPFCPRFSLVFGNEGGGLDERYTYIGQSVKIPLIGHTDSYNLAVAVGIGAYAFARKNGLV